MNIAKSLHGKPYLDEHKNIPYSYDLMTGVFTFEDGSKAKLLVRFEKCEPYMTAALSTSSHKRVREWLEVI